MGNLQKGHALCLVRKRLSILNILVVNMKYLCIVWFQKVRMFIGGHDRATWKGITLLFDKVIETKKSEFQMNARTLLSYIGGIVGYCKNALWMLILLSSFLSYTIYALREFIVHVCSRNNKIRKIYSFAHC